MQAAFWPAVRLPGCLRFPDLALGMISAWQNLFIGQFGKQDSICEESPTWPLRMKKDGTGLEGRLSEKRWRTSWFSSWCSFPFPHWPSAFSLQTGRLMGRKGLKAEPVFGFALSLPSVGFSSYVFIPELLKQDANVEPTSSWKKKREPQCQNEAQYRSKAVFSYLGKQKLDSCSCNWETVTEQAADQSGPRSAMYSKK